MNRVRCEACGEAFWRRVDNPAPPIVVAPSGEPGKKKDRKPKDSSGRVCDSCNSPDPEIQVGRNRTIPDDRPWIAVLRSDLQYHGH